MRVDSLASASTHAYSSIQPSTPAQRAGETLGQSAADRVSLSPEADAISVQKQLWSVIEKRYSADFEGVRPEIRALIDANLDWSPEGTATRIFDFTTGFFELYRRQHATLSDEEAVSGFEKLVRSAVDEGAAQAFAMLEAGGFAADEGRETMSLLHKKYDEYFATLRQNLETGSQE